MAKAYLNSISTAVPPYDIHRKFAEFAPLIFDDEAKNALFGRMVARAGIQHRYSFLEPDQDDHRLDKSGFYSPDGFPGTGARMEFYRQHVTRLANKALDQMKLADQAREITHLIVTSCTGFYAPGPDLEIIDRYGLRRGVERTIIGFMGCHAAIHALKQARHIVRSDPDAKVLILNLELCTLHLSYPETLEQLLSFVLFGDGCAASIVSAEPEGFELQSFMSTYLPDTADQMTWRIGEVGFEMCLSGEVPRQIKSHLPGFLEKLSPGKKPEITHWAIHPGGRSILDAVQAAAGLTNGQIAPSRSVLAEYGNMSSPTVMFVLQKILAGSHVPGEGVALAFGPGLSIEALRFSLAGN